MATPPPPYTGVKLSGDLSINRIAFDFGIIATFLRDEADPAFLNAQLTFASLTDICGSPILYLMPLIEEARNEFLASRAEGDPIGPPLDAALDKISGSIMADYRKFNRRLSIYLLSSVDDSIAETLRGLVDFSRICENPFYLFYSMLIITKPSPEAKHFELDAMRSELASIVPQKTESILAYTARYKRLVMRYLTACGNQHRDNISERAQQFHMSMCAHPSWKPFIMDEYMRNARWYVTWPAQQILTNEAVLSQVITVIQTRVLTGLQSVALMNKHMNAHNAVQPNPPEVKGATSAGGAQKTALAAISYSELDKPRPTCAWCLVAVGKGPHSHPTESCFAMQALGSAIMPVLSNAFSPILASTDPLLNRMDVSCPQN
jgi:hypothetical protein